MVQAAAFELQVLHPLEHLEQHEQRLLHPRLVPVARRGAAMVKNSNVWPVVPSRVPMSSDSRRPEEIIRREGAVRLLVGFDRGHGFLDFPIGFEPGALQPAAGLAVTPQRDSRAYMRCEPPQAAELRSASDSMSTMRSMVHSEPSLGYPAGVQRQIRAHGHERPRGLHAGVKYPTGFA